MQRTSALIAVCFCAGLLAALVNSVVAWLGGLWGITGLFGVEMAPEFTRAWLYPRLVWGGLWGLPYFFVIRYLHLRRRWVRKGLWLSLLPTLAQLLFFFPRFTSPKPAGSVSASAPPRRSSSSSIIWSGDFFSASSPGCFGGADEGISPRPFLFWGDFPPAAGAHSRLRRCRSGGCFRSCELGL